MQARRRLLSCGLTGVRGSLMTWSTSTHMAPIVAYANFTRPFKLHINACGSGLGLSSTILMMTVWMLSLSIPVGVWQRPNLITLANHNFQLYYKVGKTNINEDVLSRVSWPQTLETCLQVTAVAVWAMQEATLEGPTSTIKANSCDLCVLDSVEDSLQVTCMSIGDWCQAQWADLVLVLWLWDCRMELWASISLNWPILLNSDSSFMNATTSNWVRAFCIERPYQRSPKRPYSIWYCQPHTGRLPWEGATMRLAI